MSELVELMSLNTEFGTMRYAYIEGDVYFVGKDAASLLEYSDTDQALRKHVSFENSTTRRIDGSSLSDGKSRDAKFINEAGFYQLSMKSKMPKASELQNWISKDLSINIRETMVFILLVLLSILRKLMLLIQHLKSSMR